MKIFAWTKHLTPFDCKLVGVVAVLVCLSFSLLLYRSSGARVVVSSGDRVVFVAPLDKDQRVELEGPLGVTVLQIENGAARIISSPCAHKVCIRMGEARHSGDLLACVPNDLVVSIEGDSTGEDGEYDFIRR
ncbi:NusG domain II-containing protein [uncultured Desulfuromusa sp.]|uniref:NusG domain II-containing protein n=1 Tax=uncultured Desulfuromusa sp. TaxID=219183 RepID=UPI002AA8811B|nr:NusG domain II-containing protein [uncultured Desulfuromusa sp.]